MTDGLVVNLKLAIRILNFATVLILGLFFYTSAWATYIPLTVEEQDGSPSVIQTKKIKVADGALTDNGAIGNLGAIVYSFKK